MSRLPFLLFLTLIPLGSSGAASPAVPAAGFVQVQGTHLIDAAGQPLHLRGIGLGNWLVPEGYMWRFKRVSSARQIEEVVAQLVGEAAARRFWTQWHDQYITAADIRLIRQLGFNSVRVPLHHKLFLAPDDPSRLEGPGWALLDRLIGWCKTEGIYVLIDLHAAPGGQTGTDIDDSSGYPFLFEDEESQRLTVNLWRGLAVRYRDEPAVLGYDLLNEPIAHFFDPARLNPRLAPLYRRLVTAIREVDPRHVIFIGGAQWNTNFAAAGEPFAPNLVYTFHTYWTEPDTKTIEPYLAYRDKHQVPLYLGESGENKDPWIKRYRELLETHKIDWCFWPYKKVNLTTCVVSITPPENWDAVRTFAEAPRGTFEEIRNARPKDDIAARALAALLENLAVERTRLNKGYVLALGLTPPPATAPTPP